MSEKKAKEARRQEPKKPELLHRMTIDVIRQPSGQIQLHIENMPPDFDNAMNLMFDATRVMCKHFMTMVASGQAEKVEPRKIIPAAFVPKFRH